MKCSLGISDFLEEISSFSHSIIFLYFFALITEEGFLVYDELWTKVRDVVQETGIKTIPMEKKCKKAKWLSGEGLQIAVKRREAKNKGERERYKPLNAEFQRIARRDRKPFLSDQCKEIHENNRMGKTRDLFKKIKRYQGNISCKDGLNKGQKWYGPNRSRRY